LGKLGSSFSEPRDGTLDEVIFNGFFLAASGCCGRPNQTARPGG
jgi:hypothetical protein